MRNKLAEKSIDVLLDKAEEGFEIAKAQRQGADRLQQSVDDQHASAHELEDLSKGLVEEASEIKDEMETEQTVRSRVVHATLARFTSRP